MADDGLVRGRVILRRLLLALCAVGALLAVAHFAFAAWSHNLISEPEAIVAMQSAQLARHGWLYYDLATYPYTVCAYMPVFYFLVAGLMKVGAPALLAGRLISFLAFIGIVVLVWRMVLLYTKEANCALMAAGLALSTQLWLAWGTTGQVDPLAICLTLAGFFEYARFEKEGRQGSLTWAALLAVAALFTKQTAVAAPLTIFLLLAMKNRIAALRYGLIVAGGGGLLVLSIDRWLGGRFLANTVFANINPFAVSKWEQHASYMATMFVPLLFVVVVGAKRAVKSSLGGPFLYLFFSFLVLAVTGGKVGSDSNYQLETAAVMVICATLALHSLDFFPHFYRRSTALVTLLILPVGVYAVNNVRVAGYALAGRIAVERTQDLQLAQVRPYLAPGRVLSVNMNLLLRTDRGLEVEPLIYRLLCEAGRVNPAPVLADLDRGAFETVILYDDVAGPPPDEPEIASLPQAQREAIKRHYKLAAHISEPMSFYIYHPENYQAEKTQPKGQGANSL